MKDVAKYLPGIGWTFVFMEYPFLKRQWEADEKRLEAACKNLLDYPVHMQVCASEGGGDRALICCLDGPITFMFEQFSKLRIAGACCWPTLRSLSLSLSSPCSCVCLQKALASRRRSTLGVSSSQSLVASLF